MIQNKQDVEANTNQDSNFKSQNKTRYECAKSWNQVTLCIVKKKKKRRKEFNNKSLNSPSNTTMFHQKVATCFIHN